MQVPYLSKQNMSSNYRATALPTEKMNSTIRHSFYANFIVLMLVLYASNNNLASDTSTRTIYGGNHSDQLALLAFKSKLHDPHGVMNSWNSSLHFCQWQGLTCGHRHRRVTALDLHSRGLVGSLSPHIGNLSFLREIRLYNNILQGEIPPQIGRLFRLSSLRLQNNSLEGEIPANLSQCTNLILLNLGNNRLVGKIPIGIGSLSKLTILAIYQNNLSGPIPSSIWNLSSLQAISSSQNALEGNIPENLGRLKILTALGIGGNKLTGTIPSSIFNLSLLTVFSVADNQLHGNIPGDIGLSFPKLQTIELWGNQFSGPIPSSLFNASQLFRVDLSYNSFTGKVPTNLGSLEKLALLNLDFNSLGSGEADEMNFIDSLVNCSVFEKLGVNGNSLRGMLPISMGNLSTHLRYFGVGQNQLHGVIPPEIGNLVNLEILEMRNNQLEGKIPDDVGKMLSLQQLYLASNRLSGPLPSTLGNLSLLSQINLENNRLSGRIPPSLGKCQNLILLNLSYNNLNSTIPGELFSASSLSISLNLAKNHLVGTLPPEVGKLKNLVELDVSKNDLSGQIPNELRSCTDLAKLHMYSNFFNGSIPESLKALRGIQSLDLSHNNLSGKIPTFLESFSLRNLNLSFNDFEGKLPTKGVFSNASAISVAGNTRLCGGISKIGLPKCDVSVSKRKRSHLKIILISIGCILVGVTLVLTFLFLWLSKKRKVLSSELELKEPFLKVSYEILLKATDGFSSTNLIGIGSFGSVYKGKLDPDEIPVAVKVVNLQRRGASKSFMAECEALRNIRHRNLVKTITACSSIDFQRNEFKALVYEFMPNGSLESWLHSTHTHEIDNRQEEEPKTLNLLQRINVAIDVACAVDYLHHHSGTPIIHCDLKPSNVLLDAEMVAHVGDFGLARFLPELSNANQSSSVGVRGTVGYAAPEYGLGSDVSTNGDVYSYGIMLLEMIIGRRPTEAIFQEGLNLHHFARMALLDRLSEIVEPMLLEDDIEEAPNGLVSSNIASSSRSPRRAGHRNSNSKGECLISLIRIGIACSMERPQERMDISDVVNELHAIKNNLQGTRANHH